MPTAEEIAAQKKAEEDKKVAEEADKALEERIGKIANAAFTSQMKRQKPGVTAEDLDKLLDARDAKKAELAEAERKAKGEGGGQAQNAPEIAKLTKQLEELKKKADAAEAKSTAQEKAAQIAEDKATVTKTLEAAGVPAGQRARIALNHLLSEGLVKRTDDGNLVFVGKDGEEDLADGITAFLKTEDGKLFLPPSGASGSGAGAFKAGSRGKAGESKKSIAGRLLQARVAGASDE